MKHWRNLFPPHILARGQAYHEDGAVVDLKRTADGYEAVVEGTEDYRVCIALCEQTPIRMDCSCPYAQDGSLCKHMAAALFAIEEDPDAAGFPGDSRCARAAEPTPEELVARIDEGELRRLVCELAGKNDALRSALLVRCASPEQPDTLRALRQDVNAAIRQHSDRSGFIDYRHVHDFESAMLDILDERVIPLAELGKHRQAFALSTYLYEQVARVDIDDSDGTLCTILGYCCDSWADILRTCGDADRTWIGQQLMDCLEKDLPDFAADMLSDFIMEHFASQSLLERKLALIDRQIAQHDRTPTGLDSYGYAQLVLNRIELLEKLGRSAQEIDAYACLHDALPPVRQHLIRRAVSQGRTDDAISLLLRSREMDRNTGYPADYGKQLIALYDAKGDRAASLRELEAYVLTYRQADLQYILKWKAAVSEQAWPAIRERILTCPSCRPVALRLLESERLYDRLLQGVLLDHSPYTLAQYEKTLKPLYPEQLLAEWNMHLDAMAKQASNRSAYYTVMQHLLRLPQYPGGLEAAQAFARQWRTVYKRRPAMLDELKKAGF